MRGKRAKQYRKLMHAYEMTFNFREPYQVLLTADIIRAAAGFKMRTGHLLERTLHGEIKPMITQCCIRHLYDADVGNDAQAKREKDEWIAVAKQAERRRCGHHELDQPLSELECLLSVVDPKASSTNRHKYIVATQDPAMRAKMRSIPGTPLVYLNRSVMILEPMAASSEDVRDREERSKIRAGLKGAREVSVKRKRAEEEVAEEDNRMEEQEQPGDEPSRKKKKVKGPKGPNPLSAKKPKKEKTSKVDADVVAQKTRTEDPQAQEKSMKPATKQVTIDGLSQNHPAPGTNEDGSKNGPTKRKRKRKPAEGGDAVAAAVEA